MPSVKRRADGCDGFLVALRLRGYRAEDCCSECKDHESHRLKTLLLAIHRCSLLVNQEPLTDTLMLVIIHGKSRTIHGR